MNESQASLFLSRSVLSLIDEDGRPLGEHAVEGAYERAGIDERSCPYEDRRAQVDKPMNAAALRQIGRCWPEVIAQLERLAYVLAVETDHDMSKPLSAHMVWRVHLLAIAAPALFKLEHPTRHIPRTLSSLFKTSLGYASVLPSLLMSRLGVADIPLGEVLPEHDFFILSDEQGWLIGQTQVCAGSRAFIERSYRAMTRAPEHGEARATIYERTDLVELSMMLARIWARLLECAIYTRELLAHGEWERLQGYNAPRPSPQNKRTWPVCVQLFHAPNAPRHFALPRAMPALEPLHLAKLFLQRSWLTLSTPESLEEIDTRMYDTCMRLVSYFGTEAHQLDLRECLVPSAL